MRYIDKDKVIEEFLPVIKRIASDLKRTLPSNVELDDLIQEGAVALLSALDRYDPRKGNLKTFVVKRIKGAMLDYLRKLDWLPRNLRRRMKELESAMIDLESRGEDITEENLAKETGMDEETVRAVKNEMVRRQLLMLDAYLIDVDEPMIEVLSSQEDPAEQAYREMLMKAVREAIKKLSEREQLVLSLRFEEELSLKEIGAVLGVSESRVSQIISVALAKLKRELEGMV